MEDNVSAFDATDEGLESDVTEGVTVNSSVTDCGVSLLQCRSSGTGTVIQESLFHGIHHFDLVCGSM